MVDQKALAIFAAAFAGGILWKLGDKGLINGNDARELLEQALTSLETNQILAGADGPSVQEARGLFEAMIKAIPFESPS